MRVRHVGLGVIFATAIALIAMLGSAGVIAPFGARHFHW